MDWDDVWRDVASQLQRHHTNGLEHLLTEDVLRFAAVEALVAHGMQPTQLQAEWRPQPGVSVDLALGVPVTDAVEFKYPREPRETNAAWTQHLGEILKDRYRLAVLPRQVATRLSVVLASDRLLRYLTGVSDRYGIPLGLAAGQVTTLTDQHIAVLPATARGLLAAWAGRGLEIVTRSESVYQVAPGLRLLVLDVSPVDGGVPLLTP